MGGLDEKPAGTSGVPSWITGAVERLFFTLWVAWDVSGIGTAMVTWLGPKLLTNWNRFSSQHDEPRVRAFAFSALLAGLLSMLFAFVGGKSRRAGIRTRLDSRGWRWRFSQRPAELYRAARQMQ
jgi:hypothetical protein